MKGFPRNALMTHNDFEYLQQQAVDGKLPQMQVQRLRGSWQGLLDGRWVYRFDRVLADGESPDGAEPDFRVVEDEDETGAVVRRQYELVESSTARLAKLGYTVADVENKIAELDALEV